VFRLLNSRAARLDFFTFALGFGVFLMAWRLVTCTCTAGHHLVVGHIVELLLLLRFVYDIVLNVEFVVGVHYV